MTTRKIVTQQEAAEACHVTPRTIRNWITQGHITGYRLPTGRAIRVDLNQIEAMLKAIPSTQVRAGRKQPFGPKAKIVDLPEGEQADDEESDNQALTQVEAMAGADR